MHDRDRRSVGLESVGILAFDDVEVLDLCGPFQVFDSVRPVDQHDDAARLFNVIVVAEELKTLRCRGGLQITPQATIETHEPLDILILPGGPGARRERRNSRLIEWIQRQDSKVEILASVCTGALILGAAGLLAGRKATTHQSAREELGAIADVVEARVVEDGLVTTAGGVTASIDLGLHLLQKHFGPELAREVEERIEYQRPL